MFSIQIKEAGTYYFLNSQTDRRGQNADDYSYTSMCVGDKNCNFIGSKFENMRESVLEVDLVPGEYKLVVKISLFNFLA